MSFDWRSSLPVAQVTGEVAALRDELPDDWAISDVVTADGHQVVDLVQEGGGVLGVALVGYTWVLEQLGVRFLRVAGTSAGAINAMLVASQVGSDRARDGGVSEFAMDALMDADFRSFVDGDRDARDFVFSALRGAGPLKMAGKGVQVIDNISDNLGLHPGTAFYQWIHGLLSQGNGATWHSMQQALEHAPAALNLAHRDGSRSVDDIRGAVRVVAVELATRSRFILPDMADLVWHPQHVGDVEPAQFVRASMSIPFFFHPHRIPVADRGTTGAQRWYDTVRFRGTPPLEAVFVDGGLVSNFPIDLFHTPRSVPRMPTVGVALGISRAEAADVSRPGAFAWSMFESMRQVLDFEFFLRHPDYEHVVGVIDTGAHNWLNFDMAGPDRVDLFARGARAAMAWVRSFDWQEYKRIRRELAGS